MNNSQRKRAQLLNFTLYRISGILSTLLALSKSEYTQHIQNNDDKNYYYEHLTAASHHIAEARSIIRKHNKKATKGE